MPFQCADVQVESDLWKSLTVKLGCVHGELHGKRGGVIGGVCCGM